MDEPRYVQHNSGTGAMWAVKHENSYDWCVTGTQYDGLIHYLPKSEYRLCAPPTRWVDVTAECTQERNGQGDLELWRGSLTAAVVNIGYRLRKVPICTGEGQSHDPTKQWAFIVEKEEAQP